MRFITRPLLLLSTALSLLTNLRVQATTVNITVGDSFYSPAVVTAAPGDDIVFTYNGNSSHPTASDNGAWATFPMNSNNRTRTLPQLAPGTYRYHCTAHGGPGGVGMSGMIVIQPTGMRDELPAGLELTAFPNPASAARDGAVTVMAARRAGAEARVRLVNVIGRVVREARLPQGEVEGRVVLDVADLQAGVYFYSLLVGDRVVETRRLVIQP